MALHNPHLVIGIAGRGFIATSFMTAAIMAAIRTEESAAKILLYQHPARCAECLLRIQTTVIGSRLVRNHEALLLKQLIQGSAAAHGVGISIKDLDAFFPEPTQSVEEQLNILKISMKQQLKPPFFPKQSAQERRFPNQPFYARFQKPKR